MLIGEWDLDVWNASFLPKPTDIEKGSASVAWLPQGGFLAIRQGTKSGPPFSTWLIGRDDDSDAYTVLYVDTRGVSRVYQMSFADDVWGMWRAAPGFHQRFKGTVSRDGKQISGAWENSEDGGR